MDTKDIPAKKALVLLGRQEKIEDEFIKATDALPRIELSMFSDSSFDPTRYIKSILSKPEFSGTMISEKRLDFVRHLQNLLISSQKQSIHEVQKGVYAHFADYIEVGKELSRFSADMVSIRSMLHDINVTAQSNIQYRAMIQRDHKATVSHTLTSPTTSMISRKDSVSMAIEHMSVLDDLLVNVKDLKDALDKTKSQRILRIAQGPECYEIDPESYHVKPISMYIFSDVLLVTTKLRGAKSYQIQISDEDDSSLYTHAISHIVPLKDLQVKEISKIGDVDLHHAFQIIYKTSHAYSFQADSSERQRYWMREIKEAIEDHEKEQLRITQRSGMNSEFRYLNSKIPHQSSAINIIIHIDANILKELDEELGILEIQIATLHYEQAIIQKSKLLNTHKEQNYLRSRTINHKLQLIQTRFVYCERQLESFILRELVNTVLSRKRTCQLIRWSAMLNIVDKALDIFLNTQKDLIIQRTKRIKFYGNVRRFIHELSRLTVDIILDSNERLRSAIGISLNDSDSVEELIPKNRFCYIVLLWTRDRIEEFTKVFITNVFHLVKGDLLVIEDCIRIVNSQLSLLSDAGLNLSHVFREKVEPQIQLSIVQAHVSLESSLSRNEFVDHFSFEYKTHPLIKWSR